MCYKLDFRYQDMPDFVYEVFYPFGNYQSEFYDKFTIFIRSPSQTYYSDLFGSFILSPLDAWNLYERLFNEQQCPDCKKNDNDVLEAIPDHLMDLKTQFMTYYSIAYYNTINFFNDYIN